MAAGRFPAQTVWHELYPQALQKPANGSPAYPVLTTVVASHRFTDDRAARNLHSWVSRPAADGNFEKTGFSASYSSQNSRYCNSNWGFSRSG